MQWALVDSNNIVQNLLSYDGKSPYTPPLGLVLMQINPWVHIGDNIDKPKPE